MRKHACHCPRNDSRDKSFCRFSCMVVQCPLDRNNAKMDRDGTISFDIQKIKSNNPRKRKALKIDRSRYGEGYKAEAMRLLRKC